MLKLPTKLQDKLAEILYLEAIKKQKQMVQEEEKYSIYLKGFIGGLDLARTIINCWNENNQGRVRPNG